MGIRDWFAVSAHFRKGGAMKHKNSPRGGASNESRDLLHSAGDDEVYQFTCGWCKKEFGETSISGSTGICEECGDKQEAEADEADAKQAREELHTHEIECDVARRNFFREDDF